MPPSTASPSGKLSSSEAVVLVARLDATAGVRRKRGAREQTFQRWKSTYGVMPPSDAARLGTPEDERPCADRASRRGEAWR